MARNEENLRIFLITPRAKPESPDCWEEAMVAASDPSAAKLIHPNAEAEEWDDEKETWGDDEDDQEWVPPYDVVAEEKGIANKHAKMGVMMARFETEEEEEEDY